MQLQMEPTGWQKCFVFEPPKPRISTKGESTIFFKRRKMDNILEVWRRASRRETKEKMHACLVVTNDEEEQNIALAQPLLGLI